MIGLVALIAAVSVQAAGCRTEGRAVLCALGAPVAVPAPIAAKAETVSLRTRSRARHARRKTVVAHARPKDAGPPSVVEIGRHIESLVSIDDCTGARDYARSVADAGLADRTFAACIAHPPAPRETAAR